MEDPKGRRSFPQNHFQCPRMVGVERTLYKPKEPRPPRYTLRKGENRGIAGSTLPSMFLVRQIRQFTLYKKNDLLSVKFDGLGTLGIESRFPQACQDRKGRSNT